MCTNVVCFRVLDGKSYTAAWYHRPGTFSILNCQLVKEGWRFIALLCTFFFLLLSLRCNVVQILFSFNDLFFCGTLEIESWCEKLVTHKRRCRVGL